MQQIMGKSVLLKSINIMRLRLTRLIQRVFAQFRELR